MVKNKKALTLLLVFLVFFNSPAYPKDKRIKYLPANYTSDTVSADYSNDPLILKQLDGGEYCSDDLFSVSECNKCVELKKECPDCCLTTDSLPKAIKCSPGDEDTSADYNCTEPPFLEDCPQTECGAGTTGTGGSRSSDDSTDCENLICSSGSVSSGSPYRLQRRGCPDEDSDELAPKCSDGTVCTDTETGTGINRVWTCPPTAACSLGNISPSFVEPCSASSGPGRCDNLASYYVVEHVWEDNSTICTDSCACSSPACSTDSPAAECNTYNYSSFACESVFITL